MKKRKIDKQGQPAKCDICGEVTHQFVCLLVSPDPVEHETWCDPCYTKAQTEKQHGNL
jgi:hypothetical protein